MKVKKDWNMKPLGKKYNDPAFFEERSLQMKKAKAFARKWKKDRTFLTEASSLKKALDQYNLLCELGTKEDVYLWMMSKLDAGNKKITAAMNKHYSFSQELAKETRFFVLDLGLIELKKQKEFLLNPILSEYQNFLRVVFKQSKYRLSEAEERILSMKFKVSHQNWADMLSGFLAQDTQATLVPKKNSQGSVSKQTGLEELITLSSNSNKKIRISAKKALDTLLKRHLSVAEKEINSILENKQIDDKLRSYDRPDSSRHINEDIDTAVVDTLREIVKKNNAVSQKFYALKAELLKMESFHYSERNLTYGSAKKEYGYEQALTIVRKSFEAIDGEFVEVFDEIVASGFVDVYPKEGKRGGAFCLSHGIHDPVYVFLNYTNTTRDVLTLAHEMGHAVHAVLSKKKEKQITYHPPMCTAEVASTFCEDFVFDELLKKANDNERLVLMMGQLQDKINTIFRQIAAYNFEFDLHVAFREKGYVPASDISRLFIKNMKSYLGPKFMFDEDAGNGWVYWSHFRRPFYVYSYALGLLAAQSMRAEFINNPAFINGIKSFYSVGSCMSPREIFTNMGIDIDKSEFWEQGISEIKQLLKDTRRLAKKLKKI
jgi:oligoendopeptidase F